MGFGALQQGKSYRQLWRRSSTRTPPVGRGAASLVLGSDSFDEKATLQTGDRISVSTSGVVNNSKKFALRGVFRLNEVPPEGYAWQFSTTLGAYTEAFIVPESTFKNLPTPVEFSLSDYEFNIAGLAGVVTPEMVLELVQDPNNPGLAGTDVEVTLPSVYIDQIAVPETVTNDLYLGARFPSPGQESVVNELPVISFVLNDVSGVGVDLPATVVTVEGTVVFSGGSFVFPWSGSVFPGIGPTGNDIKITLIPPSSFLPLASEQTVEVNVVSQLIGPASPINETWSFVAADTLSPAVQSASMIEKNVLRVVFTDDVLLTNGADGALNASNYSITRMSIPAVSLSVVSVTSVSGSSNAVDVLLNWEASQGAKYTLAVANVKDVGGNVIAPTGQVMAFLGYVPPKPLGRRFELLDALPAMNLKEDVTAAQGAAATQAGTGDLRKFILVLQDVVDLLLCQIDRWTEIIDIDLAPEIFLDAILQDLGNPFSDCIADLSITDKRRLARVLISIYKEKGTEVGIVNAIRFFLGIEVTLDILNFHNFWQLNISLLGLDTVLAPPVGSPLWYSFFVVSPVLLTDEQRARILCIADYMKGAHEHVLGIVEPGQVVTPSNFWILNQSLLGADPSTLPSTILA